MYVILCIIACVCEPQTQTQDKRNYDNTVRWAVKHSYPTISTSRFISPLHARRDAAGCEVRLIEACDTFMSTDLTHDSRSHAAHILAAWKQRRSILSCFHPPQAKEFLIDSAGKLRERQRRMLERLYQSGRW